jgi:PPK2 family polyphosphate:nucleotide phosphotransferase
VISDDRLMSVPSANLRELLGVGPGPVDLGAIDPGGTPGLPEKKAVRRSPKSWVREDLTGLGAELARYQEMLYANAKVAGATPPSEAAEKPSAPPSEAAGKLNGEVKRVLLVLQAMDCGGKDGTIKRVAGHMNPLGLHIRAFGKPTQEEMAHHFLWRIRRALPPPGYVGMFNRSHYEDVLVVRVHSLVPQDIWQGRYDEINQFERELVDGGVTLVKVMLHISYEEQRQRLLQRLDDPTKHWKYNRGDVDERVRWADYQAAYVDALSRCGTDGARWHVVPADHKWYRDWAVTNLLLEHMRELDLSYPPGDFDPETERKRLARIG